MFIGKAAYTRLCRHSLKDRNDLCSGDRIKPTLWAALSSLQPRNRSEVLIAPQHDLVESLLPMIALLSNSVATLTTMLALTVPPEDFATCTPLLIS